MLPHSLYPLLTVGVTMSKLKLILLSQLPTLTYNRWRHRWVVLCFFAPHIFHFWIKYCPCKFPGNEASRWRIGPCQASGCGGFTGVDVEESESRPAFSKRVKMLTDEAENQFALIPEEDFPPSAQRPPSRHQHLPPPSRIFLFLCTSLNLVLLFLSVF